MKSNGNGHWNCGPLTGARKTERDTVEHLSRVVQIARVLRRTVKTNILWAFSYNGVAVDLAAGGLLQPILPSGILQQ